MSSEEQIILLCRAEFLQDFSIELGRRLKPIRNTSKSVLAKVDIHEHDGQSFERLSVWIESWYRTRVTLNLWEDRTIWVNVALLKTDNNKPFQIAFYPLCDGFSVEGIAEALRETISVSTRLCYSESPLPTLRRI